MSEKTDEKINDLHLAVAKMRQQQDELHKKLKLEQEKKEKLEVVLQFDSSSLLRLSTLTLTSVFHLEHCGHMFLNYFPLMTSKFKFCKVLLMYM